MWPWTAATQGYIYLFHFHQPLGNLTNSRAQARHYVGFAEDLAGRLAVQVAGRGAKIVRAAVERGIAFDIFSWPAPLAVEKLIKDHKKTQDFCPTCCRAVGRTPRPLPVVAEQLVLPLGEDDWPAPLKRPVDWYEINYYRNQRAARPVCAPLADNWDDGLL
jgi:hypothetical protein